MTKSQGKNLDDAIKLAAYEKAKFRCVVCGKERYLNHHHLIDRSVKKFRWNIFNVIALCPNHHKLRDYSIHKNPHIWTSQLQLKGDKWMVELLVDYDPSSKDYLDYGHVCDELYGQCIRFGLEKTMAFMKKKKMVK